MKNCYVCNSPMRIDYSGSSEMYGHDWQDVTISCTRENCFTSLTLSTDFSYTKSYCSDDLEKLWDSLEKPTEEQK